MIKVLIVKGDMDYGASFFKASGLRVEEAAKRAADAGGKVSLRLGECVALSGKLPKKSLDEEEFDEEIIFELKAYRIPPELKGELKRFLNNIKDELDEDQFKHTNFFVV